MKQEIIINKKAPRLKYQKNNYIINECNKNKNEEIIVKLNRVIEENKNLKIEYEKKLSIFKMEYENKLKEIK